MEDFRARISKSIDAYSRKQIVKSKPKRNSPEKTVEIECMKWFKANDFDMTVVDSGFQTLNQRKVGESGFTDSCGNHGLLSAWVEFKAPGKLSTLSEMQFNFITRKIDAGCFAVAVDSVRELARLWHDFSIEEDWGKRRDLLLESLPNRSKFFDRNRRSTEPLFNCD